MHPKRKTAVITGASRGIGEAIATCLAAEGYNLVLIGRDLDRLGDVSARCQKFDVKVHVISFDLTQIDQIPGLVANVLSMNSTIDVLINNAGVFVSGDLSSGNFQDWDLALDLNFRSVYHLTNRLLNSFGEDGGTIINVSSISALISSSGSEIYSATKAALKAYSSSLFESVREKGIKVTCLMPGFVNTDMGQAGGLISEKMIQPEDVAKTVSWIINTSTTVCPTEIILRPQHSPYRQNT
jgi:short-subunit dehydrogenase